MATVYLLLGSNLGDRAKNIENALEELEKIGVIILKKSSLYETKPWGYKKQPDFLNLAIECSTSLSPFDLLGEIKKIEIKMGRQNTIKYGPRIIDIDIIFYDNLILKSDTLTIPHPLMHEREFALKPLCEIAPHIIHPELKVSLKELLKQII